MSGDECVHEFDPIPGWRGRYRCKWCGALAYRKFVLGDALDGGGRADMDGPIYRTTRLVLYRCSVRGCEEPAVSYKRTKHGQLCREHLKEKLK